MAVVTAPSLCPSGLWDPLPPQMSYLPFNIGPSPQQIYTIGRLTTPLFQKIPLRSQALLSPSCFLTIPSEMLVSNCYRSSLPLRKDGILLEARKMFQTWMEDPHS